MVESIANDNNKERVLDSFVFLVNATEGETAIIRFVFVFLHDNLKRSVLLTAFLHIIA